MLARAEQERVALDALERADLMGAVLDRLGPGSVFVLSGNPAASISISLSLVHSSVSLSATAFGFLVHSHSLAWGAA